MSIDPTDFVQTEGDALSLKFGNPHQQAKFELGVCMSVYKWEELTTAVENSWGGPNSADKRDWISGVIIELFEGKEVDLILIEETLLYAMVDEFDTEIDNDSALVIADLILKIYRECSMENYTRVDDLYSKYQQKQALGARAEKVSISADPNNPDSSDEEDEEEEHEAASAHEDLMDVDETSKAPVVDDDGFELVQRRGRRR